ncbi:MAG: DsbA family protein [Leptospirales bacterium]
MDGPLSNEISKECLYAEWFTDPVCAWSFAAEDAITAFRHHFSGRLIFKNRMFILYTDVSSFLGAHGMKTQSEFAPKVESVARATSKRLDSSVWRNNNAPKSSEQCCLWVKAAQLLDSGKGDVFLSEMRKALFLEGKNISDDGVLADLAELSGLEFQALRLGILSQKVRAMLDEDQTLAKEEKITVRPTLVLKNSGGDRVFIGGLMDSELFIHAGEVLLREA